VDPSDSRRLVLCGQRGSLIVLRLNHMARDKVEQQQYKVDMSASKAGDTLRAAFSTTRDLLYVLLPREVCLQPTSRRYALAVILPAVHVSSWQFHDTVSGRKKQICTCMSFLHGGFWRTGFLWVLPGCGV
jgi:hypothetical protein